MRFFDESDVERSARVCDWQPNQQPQFRFLIIGCGMIGREHIRVTRLLGKAAIVGLVDPHQPSIDAALSLFQDSAQKPAIYESIDQALQEAQPDAVFVCTPNYTHFAIVEKLVESGLPLFVEKPMATSLADAAGIVQMAKEHKSFVQIGMQYRFKSQYSEAFRQVKAQQALGAIKTISMSEYRPPFLDKVNQWNKFNEYSGGTLVEKCCHYFDLINLMAESKPVSVYATGGQAVNFLDFEQDGKPSDIHDHSFVVIDYENGIRASFTLNMFTQELFEEFIIGGENGRLIATESSTFKRDEPSVGRIKVEVDGHQDYEFRETTYPEIIERSGHHGATFFEHEAFIDQLQGTAQDAATVVQGFRAMALASAAQESIAQGTPVNIDDYLRSHQLAWI